MTVVSYEVPVVLPPLAADPVGQYTEGATYWNYATGRMRVYTSGAWTNQ